jgi:hypothetical protein
VGGGNWHELKPISVKERKKRSLRKIRSPRIMNFRTAKTSGLPRDNIVGHQEKFRELDAG